MQSVQGDGKLVRAQVHPQYVENHLPALFLQVLQTEIEVEVGPERDFTEIGHKAQSKQEIEAVARGVHLLFNNVGVNRPEVQHLQDPTECPAHHLHEDSNLEGLINAEGGVTVAALYVLHLSSLVGVNHLGAWHHREAEEAQALRSGDADQEALSVQEDQISAKVKALSEARVSVPGVLHPSKCEGVSYLQGIDVRQAHLPDDAALFRGVTELPVYHLTAGRTEWQNVRLPLPRWEDKPQVGLLRKARVRLRLEGMYAESV